MITLPLPAFTFATAMAFLRLPLPQDLPLLSSLGSLGFWGSVRLKSKRLILSNFVKSSGSTSWTPVTTFIIPSSCFSAYWDKWLRKWCLNQGSCLKEWNRMISYFSSAVSESLLWSLCLSCHSTWSRISLTLWASWGGSFARSDLSSSHWGLMGSELAK